MVTHLQLFSRVKEQTRAHWGLWLVVALSLVLRYWSIDFGLPYLIAPDESTHVGIALRMFQTGDLNPHWLLYPTLWLYLNALAYVPYFLAGKWLGILALPSDIPFPRMEALGVGLSLMPSQYILQRGLTAAFGTGSVILTYLIGERVCRNEKVALFAATLMAISPTNVANSKLIRPDTYSLFFILLSFFWAHHILTEPKRRHYVLAGLAAGWAVSCKYNAGLVVLPIIVAHFARFGWRGLRQKELYIGLAASVVGFVATTPFAALDWSSFLYYLRSNANEYATGHAGSEGDTLGWYISYLISTEGVFVFAAIGQMLLLLYRREKAGLLLLVFPAAYLIFINLFVVRNDRTILLVIPFLILLAAQFTDQVAQWVAKGPRALARWSIAVFLAFGLLQGTSPLIAVVNADRALAESDGRDQAREWIDANVPPHSRIALESYSPYVDPARYSVIGVGALPDHSPDWYIDNGYEYLVVSAGTYGRFFANPERYADWIDKYNAFFNRFALAARFDLNGYQVQVYKTGVALPTHRVAAHFGDQGGVIELVGYEECDDSWEPGQPLCLELYWNATERSDQPLELELKLLGSNDRQVGSARGDLFQSSRALQGIQRVRWLLPTAATLEPGVYRVDVQVVQEEYHYQTPITNSAGEPIERLALGPFKLHSPSLLPDELSNASVADIRWQDELTLLSYRIERRDGPTGSGLLVTLHWQSTAARMRDYTVFLHLLDAEGKIRAQVDASPRGGAYPTSIWDEGEIISDEHMLPLSDVPIPGTYRVELGLYEWPSLTRLAAKDATGADLGDHWVLPEPVKLER